MIQRLRLSQFRCHEYWEWSEPGARAILLGKNGTGKSSVLEAIYFMARGRSFRTTQTKDCVREGAEAFGIRIDGDLVGASWLKVEWGGLRRFWEKDGETLTNASEVWGVLSAVAFLNRDLSLVQSGSTERRRWLDALIASARPERLRTFRAFDRNFKQRQALLQAEYPDRGLWDILTEQHDELGTLIRQWRGEVLCELGPELESIYAKIGGGTDSLRLLYLKASHEAQAMESAEKRWRAERAARTSLHGAQRDELVLELSGHDLRRHGSEGQQRSAALALKMAEASFLSRHRPRPPVLLLDDVFHELDQGRRECFASLLPDRSQIFLATAMPVGLPDAMNDGWTVRRVDSA